MTTALGILVLLVLVAGVVPLAIGTAITATLSLYECALALWQLRRELLAVLLGVGVIWLVAR